MSKNEEQFYGMFREAFDNFSPEVPAHIYDNVRAGMVRSAGFNWKKWSAALLLLLGAGTFAWSVWPVNSAPGKSISQFEADNVDMRIANMVALDSEPNNNSALACAASASQSASKRNNHNVAIGANPYHETGIVSNSDPSIAPKEVVIDNPIIEVAASNPIDPIPAPIIESAPSAEESAKTKVIWPIKVKKTVTIDQ